MIKSKLGKKNIQVFLLALKPTVPIRAGAARRPVQRAPSPLFLDFQCLGKKALIL